MRQKRESKFYLKSPSKKFKSGNLLETGAGQFSRFTFDKFVFDATGEIFGHCEVVLCNAPSTTCTSSCTGEDVTVSIAINV